MHIVGAKQPSPGKKYPPIFLLGSFLSYNPYLLPRYTASPYLPGDRAPISPVCSTPHHGRLSAHSCTKKITMHTGFSSRAPMWNNIQNYGPRSMLNPTIEQIINVYLSLLPGISWVLPMPWQAVHPLTQMDPRPRVLSLEEKAKWAVCGKFDNPPVQETLAFVSATAGTTCFLIGISPSGTLHLLVYEVLGQGPAVSSKKLLSIRHTEDGGLQDFETAHLLHLGAAVGV